MSSKAQLTFTDSSSSESDDDESVPNISQNDQNRTWVRPSSVSVLPSRDQEQKSSSCNISRGQAAESNIPQIIPESVSAGSSASALISKSKVDVFMDSNKVIIENKVGNIIPGVDSEDTPHSLNKGPSKQLTSEDSSLLDHEKYAILPQENSDDEMPVRMPLPIFPCDSEYTAAGRSYEDSCIARISEVEPVPDMSCLEVRHINEELELNELSVVVGSLTKSEAESLGLFLQEKLQGRAHEIKLNHRILSRQPCVVTLEKIPVNGLQDLLPGQVLVAESIQQLKSRQCITVEEMGRICESSSSQMISEKQLFIVQRRLEINANHPLIKNLSLLKDSDPNLATMLANQIFTMGMITAGIPEEDPKEMVSGLVQLLTKVLENSNQQH